MARPRVALHVQHLLGIGHLRRAAALARALSAQGAEVLVLSGGVPVPGIDFGGATLHQLPAAVTADTDFSHLLDSEGRPIDDDWKAMRRSHLLQAVAAFRPDILLIEMFPFGRRPFRFELLPLLDWARAQNPRPLVASSVRDILVEKGKPGRAAEIAQLVKDCFDLVLVHGDADLVPFGRTFPEAAAIADRLVYTGYVVQVPDLPPRDRTKGDVLVSAGGGAVGAPLLHAALAARAYSGLRDRPWRLIAGQNLPAADYAALAAAAALDPGVVLERHRTDFTELLASCHVSLSQGGYNTVMEILALQTPALVVPFAEGAESEQTLRATILAERGALDCLGADALAPRELAARLDHRARLGSPAFKVAMNGAERSAEILLERAAHG
ncbi:glycosyltransferase family protein [Dongia sp.]|uniref:glycosyltransferase family protein n=1 Tax=Dongia sp. TaxID=1977262 RepID=UPI0035B368EB